MKTFFSPFLISSLLAVGAHAQTVIINASTGNGAFELPVATGTQASAADWTSGIFSTDFQRRDDDATHPGYAAIVGTASGGTSTSGALQLTSYTVQTGDLFSLSFEWKSAFGWDSSDKLNWHIFSTDDNSTSGTLTTIASGFVTGKSGNSEPYNWGTADVLVNGGTVVGANIGQQLFIEFYGTNSSQEFARFDSVVLTVIPEPATYTLIAGIFAVGVLAIRRRQRA